MNLSPDFGYFVVKNLSAGFYLPLEITRSKTKWNSYSEEYHNDGYSVGIAPYVRYYIPVKTFFLVTEASYDWYYSKNTYYYRDQFSGAVKPDQEMTTKHESFSLAAGPAVFLNPYTSLEVLANYQHANFEYMDQSKFYVSIGLQIYIPSRKE